MSWINISWNTTLCQGETCTRMIAGDMSATVTFINSIVGVSVLTLPCCYKQCGLIFGTVLLLFCAWLSYQSSMMLVKTAVSNKRKTYFGLAKLSYGGAGKLVAELSVIGLLFGTCVTFHVVMEDLVAILLESLTGLKVSQAQRIGLLFLICTFVVLPLSLRKNVTDSVLWSIVALICYAVFVCVLFILCCHHLISNSWKIGRIALWRWDGFLKSLPIFTATFSCHPQILPLFFHQSVESVERMSGTSKKALSITAGFYSLVGIFGYTIYSEGLSGNILADLPSGFVINTVRAIFLISLMVGFPLIVLPCRQAISTLLFEQQKPDGTFSVSGDLPLRYHFVTTVVQVFSSMTIGIIVPDVETVLGLMGATTCAVTCFILPSLMHSKLRKGRFSIQHASEELPYKASSKEIADQGTEVATGREDVTEMMLLTVGILLLLSGMYSGIPSELPEEINIQPIRKFLAVPENSDVESSIAKRNVENSLDSTDYMTQDFLMRNTNGYPENEIMDNVVERKDIHISHLEVNAERYKPKEATTIMNNSENNKVQSESHMTVIKDSAVGLTTLKHAMKNILNKLRNSNDQFKTQQMKSSDSVKVTEMVPNNLDEMQVEKSAFENDDTTLRNFTVEKER